MPIPIVAVGECMLELMREGDHWRLSHSGDTFNTALYLTRLGLPVAFLTALGDDPFSAEMLAAWRTEGLDTELVLTGAGRLCGLYAIQTDAVGERSFHYWRAQSAARELLRLPGSAEALARAEAASLLYLSGITLSLFDAADLNRLADAARRVLDRGGEVAFDPNYRARGWASADAARKAIEALAPQVSIALPTFEDEAALHGDTHPRQTLVRWREAGAREVVVKLGAAGCLLDDGRVIAPTAALSPVDTTAAGDAFNAAYLAARRRGWTQPAAAAFANRLAGRVILHRGAILPPAEMADLAAALAGPPEGAT